MVVIPVLEVPLLIVVVILLVHLISLYLVVPPFSVVLLLQEILLQVSKIHSIMCQLSGGPIASLMFESMMW